jgi:hypothetical protein
MIKTQHDKFFRKSFGRIKNAVDLIENCLPPGMIEPLNLQEMQPLPNNDFGKGLDEHIIDLKFIAPTKEGRGEALAMIFTEHKSYPDNNVSFQIGRDLFAGWIAWWINNNKPDLKQHPLPAPILILLYNGKEPLSVLRLKEIVTKIRGLEIFIPDFEIWVVDLSKIPPEKIRGNPVTKASLLALKYGGEGTITEHLSDIFENYRSLPLNDELRENVQNIVEYAHSNNNNLNISQVENALENVFPESEIKIMTNVMLKDIRAEGKAEGEAKIILRTLTRRLGHVPESVREQLDEIKDIERLDQLADVALDCQSLDEFEKQLK